MLSQHNKIKWKRNIKNKDDENIKSNKELTARVNYEYLNIQITTKLKMRN